jgi:sortase A
MQSKILLKRILFIVIFTGFVFFVAISYYFISKSSDQLDKNESASLVKSIAIYGLPVHLRIPKINFDGFVEHGGLTSDGAMNVPKILDDIAWFELGPRPGEIGSAVIVGHYGQKDGVLGAFNDLYKLRIGDKVYVEDDKGATVSFVVREIQRYDGAADASTIFGSNDEKAHLNLITCEGVWDKNSESYSGRLVVFTDKEIN